MLFPVDHPVLAKSAPVPSDKAHQDLKKATQQFEGYFLHQLFKEMRKTVPDDTLLKDDGHGKEIFQDMMDQTMSDNMASRGDLGMAKMLYDQLAPSLGHSTATPGHSTATPGHSTDMPGHSTDMPGHSTDMPGHSTDMPGHSTDMPGHSTDMPGHSTDEK